MSIQSLMFDYKMINSSLQFKFNLYVEVKRTLATCPMEEVNMGKVKWLKVEDINNDLYNDHFKPALFNTDVKILTTEQYVPKYLRKFRSDCK